MTTEIVTGLNPEGKKLLRIEARNAEVPIERKPDWIKTKLKTGPEYTRIREMVKKEGLHTVCQEAGCPNIFECWEDREATFLIGGSACTRRCDFSGGNLFKSSCLEQWRSKGVNSSGDSCKIRLIMA